MFQQVLDLVIELYDFETRGVDEGLEEAVEGNLVIRVLFEDVPEVVKFELLETDLQILETQSHLHVGYLVHVVDIKVDKDLEQSQRFCFGHVVHFT